LTDTCRSFGEHCAVGIEADRERIAHYVHDSLMLVTALSPHIGYDAAAKVAKVAHKNKKNLREVCLDLELLSGEDFDRLVQPEKMVGPG